MTVRAFFWTAFVCLFCSLANPVLAHNPTPEDWFVSAMNDLLNDIPDLNDDEYKMRLETLSGEIEYKLDPMVKEQIILRVEKARASTEKLLGRSDIYFPIFEEFLAKYNVPHQIKYLSIIESHLIPYAKSPAGAAGLWQFIPSTAKLYGMSISSTVDERSNTYIASEKAARMLAELYNYYSDWSLALAAYNCGAGRVNGAIKKAGSRDYWKVRNFLPYETQKYVPYFMAMVYAGEYAHLHDINPEKQHTDLVLTDTILLSESTSWSKLSTDIGLSVDTIKFLNPSFLKNYVPRTTKTNVIILPARVVAAMRGYEDQLAYVQSIQRENPIRAVRRIFKQEDLQFLAKAFRCTEQDLLVWNSLPENYQVKAGDLVAIRKFAASKDLLASRQPVQVKKLETIDVASLRVVGLKSNKALISKTDQPIIATEPVVANPMQNVAAAGKTTTPAATAKKSSSNEVLGIAPSKKTTTTEEKPKAADHNNAVPVAESVPQTYRDQVERATGTAPTERSRERRLREETTKPLDTKTSQDTTVPDQKTIQQKPTNTDGSSGNATPRSRERNLRNGLSNTEELPIVESNESIVQTSAPNTNNNKPQTGYVYYMVEQNQTVWDVRRLYPNVTIKELFDLNNLKNESELYAGLVLKIPVK